VLTSRWWSDSLVWDFAVPVTWLLVRDARTTNTLASPIYLQPTSGSSQRPRQQSTPLLLYLDSLSMSTSTHTHVAKYSIPIVGLDNFVKHFYHTDDDKKVIKDYLTMKLHAWAENHSDVNTHGKSLEVE
jgi:hypothetical protein